MKIVKESISFKREENSHKALGIGNYNKIEQWLNNYKGDITNYIINDDLTIDTEDDVWLNNKELIELPEYIQFNRIGGCFFIHNNDLISLRGCPIMVGISFYCHNNKLLSLDYCPKEIGKTARFTCNDNLVKFSKEEVMRRCKNTEEIYIEV